MDDALIDYRNRRNNFWKLLRTLRQEYNSVLKSTTELVFSFTEYVEANYGIVLQYDTQGNITSDYSISDEARYTFCLLRHG